MFASNAGETAGPGRGWPGKRGFGYAAWGLVAAGLLSIFLACLFGSFPIPFGDVLKILMNGLWGERPADGTWSVVILDLRLSRICLAWLVGAALSVSGAVFQGILRNPLADPFTLGVSTGAAFGASLAIYLGLSGASMYLAGIDFLPLAALAGALAALAAVIILSRVGGYLQRETLVLAGIVVATFLAALISLIKSLDEESVTNIVFWIMGSFQGRGWGQCVAFSAVSGRGLVDNLGAIPGNWISCPWVKSRLGSLA